MIVSERSTMTPRIRRELPSSFLGRLILTWLTPGPSTGLVFVISMVWILAIAQQFGLYWILRSGIAPGGIGNTLRTFLDLPGLLLPAYLVCFLVCVRLVMFRRPVAQQSARRSGLGCPDRCGCDGGADTVFGATAF